MANNINKSVNSFADSTFKENSEYLNWPGLQYLFYAKIKPLVKNTVGETKNIRDDENWYASYDPETGQVYLVSSDDNQVLFIDSDGSCGSITDTGMLQIVVDRARSAMINGFIDNRYGCIGVDGHSSDEIGEATGKLYVNFSRGDRSFALINDGYSSLIPQKLDRLEKRFDSHVKIQSVTTGGGYTSEQISNPEYQTVVIDASGHILESVDNYDNVFVADILDGEENIEGFIDYNKFIQDSSNLENPEFSRAITDNDERLLYGLRNDSTEYNPDVDLKEYRIDNVSVKKIVRNVKKMDLNPTT